MAISRSLYHTKIEVLELALLLPQSIPLSFTQLGSQKKKPTIVKAAGYINDDITSLQDDLHL